MSDKTVGRVEGKTRTDKTNVSYKGYKLLLINMGEKIIQHKRTAEEVKMVIPWNFVHSKKKPLKIDCKL